MGNVKINISEELLKIGLLCPHIKKFMKFLFVLDIYEDFIKVVTERRESGLTEPPKKSVYVGDIIKEYTRYHEYRIAYFRDRLWDWEPDDPDQDPRCEKYRFWETVNELWQEALSSGDSL